MEKRLFAKKKKKKNKKKKTRTQNHLVLKRTLNHLAKVAKHFQSTFSCDDPSCVLIPSTTRHSHLYGVEPSYTE